MRSEIKGNYDIIIIGAGPAGCMAAKFLRPDLSILLIDKSPLPRDKSCGGLLSDESQEFFRQNNIPPPKEIFTSPIPTNLIVMDWDSMKEATFDANFANMSRKAFDRWLLSLVPQNVQIAEMTKLLDIQAKTDALDVQLQHQQTSMTLKARYLIGADGGMSKTRRLVCSESREATYFATIQEWIVPNRKIDHFACILDRELTSYFCWFIPKDDMLIIGGGFDPKETPKEKFKSFKAKLKYSLDLYGDAVKQEGDVIRCPKSTREIVLGQGRVMLAGEAAGLISPSSGDGISFALHSGHACAEAINADFDRAFLTYDKKCRPLVSMMRTKILKSRLLYTPLGRRLLRAVVYRKRDSIAKRRSF